MPLIVWACPLIVQRDTSMPKVVQVLDTIGPHETSWSTTPGQRTAPYAAGCSSVDAAQLAALQADAQILLWEEADWQQPFSSLPGSVRSRLNQFCTQVGIAQPQSGEVIRDVLTRMTTLIDSKLLEAHIVQVQRQQGSRTA